MKQFVHNISP